MQRKNVLIVGGTSGIGAEVVRQLHGNNIFITGRNKNMNTSSDLTYIPIDVTNEFLDFKDLPETLDGLVYCPGTINLKPFSRLTREDFYSDWNVNFYGAVKVVQSVLEKLKMAKSPSVVFFSTVAVGMGLPYHASIASAKGAVEGLTKSLAAEYAPHIRVNCISPSLTITPLSEKLTNSPDKIEAGSHKHPLKRLGSPEEIASVAGFLLSDNASWMTGQILHVDGGISSLKV